MAMTTQGVNLAIGAEIDASARQAWDAYRKNTKQLGALQKKELSISKSMAAKKANAVFRSLRASVNSLGSSMLRIGKYTAIAFGAAAVKGLYDASNAASDYEESLSKFSVVFGEATAEMKKWSDTNAQALGTSRREMLGFLASTQDLLVPMGVAGERAEAMSKQVAQLVPDLASFNNLPTSQVLRDIQAALTGSGETMKKYGVVINETSIKKYAFSKGIVEANQKTKDYTNEIVALQYKIKELGKVKTKSTAEWMENRKEIEAAKNEISQYKAAMKPATAEITAQQKAQAILGMIMEGTTAAQGDAIRTADSHANLMRRLSAAYENVSAKIGVYVNDAIDPLITATTDWIAQNEELIAQKIGEYVEEVADFAQNAFETIQQWAKDGTLSDWFDTATLAAYEFVNAVAQVKAGILSMQAMYQDNKSIIDYISPASGYILDKTIGSRLKDPDGNWRTSSDDLMNEATEISTRYDRKTKEISSRIADKTDIRAAARRRGQGDIETISFLIDEGISTYFEQLKTGQTRARARQAALRRIGRF